MSIADAAVPREVKELESDTNNFPVSFWATFEQRCDGEIPSLTGEVLYNAHRPVILQAPRQVMVLWGQDLSFAVTATTTNFGPVTLTATGLRNGATLTDNGNNTGTFSWVLIWGQIGNTNITVRGMNTLGNVGDFAIGIVVTPQNGTFSLQAESDPAMGSNEGQMFLFTLTNAVFQTSGSNVNSANIFVGDHVGTATVSVVRSGGDTLPLMMEYATSNRPAQAGSDYTAISGTLTFGPGVTSQALTIPVTSGCASNGPKSVTLLLNPSGSRSARKATLSIMPE